MTRVSSKGGFVRVLALAAALWALAAASASPDAVSLKEVATGLSRPLALAHAGDGSDRLFIVQQNGVIRILDGEELLDEPFLDLTSRVSCCVGERGMLGMTFHPDYENSGHFYVTYHNQNDRSILSRFTVSSDPDRTLPGSEEVLLRIPQPSGFHNVGTLAFGPDGYLYVGTGDGGGVGSRDNAQDLGSLLGKILRLDVDGEFPYAIPPDNPFVGDPDARDEIWAYGLRNPWRFSFDRRKGHMFIGDVGQNAWEEVNFEPAGSPGGVNYGWPVMEASACFDPPEGCDTSGLTLPILEYPHEHEHEGEEAGCLSVIGGHQYRGPGVATLGRFYFFGDFCSGEIWGARRNAAGAWVANEMLHADFFISSFGEDERGRVYVVDLGGTIYQLVGDFTFASDFEDGFAGWSARPGRVAIAGPGLRGSGSALAVTLLGPRRWSSVKSRHPDAESTFQVSFDFNANRAELAGEPVDILRLLDRNTHVRVVLEPAGGGYRVALWVWDGGGFRRVDGAGVPAAGTVSLKLRWMQASVEGVADGEAVLIRDGSAVASARDLDNHDRTVRTVLLGVPRGSGAGSSGSLLFDNYRSTP